MKPEIIYKLFQCDPACKSHTVIHMERRIQFLFLSIICRMRMPLIIWSLKGNCTVTCRDLEKMLHSCAKDLPPEMLNQLKWVPQYCISSKFKGDVISY